MLLTLLVALVVSAVTLDMLVVNHPVVFTNPVAEAPGSLVVFKSQGRASLSTRKIVPGLLVPFAASGIVLAAAYVIVCGVWHMARKVSVWAVGAPLGTNVKRHLAHTLLWRQEPLRHIRGVLTQTSTGPVMSKSDIKLLAHACTWSTILSGPIVVWIAVNAALARRKNGQPPMLTGPNRRSVRICNGIAWTCLVAMQVRSPT